MNFLISYIIVKFFYDIIKDYREWKVEREISVKKQEENSEEYINYLSKLATELNLRGIKFSDD